MASTQVPGCCPLLRFRHFRMIKATLTSDSRGLSPQLTPLVGRRPCQSGTIFGDRSHRTSSTLLYDFVKTQYQAGSCGVKKFKVQTFIDQTGVGKFLLINYAFGVRNATSSHDKPGEASMDHELISPQNDGWHLLETGVEQFLTSKCEGELGTNHSQRGSKFPLFSLNPTSSSTTWSAGRTLDKSSPKGLSKETIEKLAERKSYRKSVSHP
ncbi:uncharacterized protein BJ212DRAFT_1298134 [Suillus subaureus]|uniref:Uncharacterized protein n=1 Tax=Suillus subaureus TaxID=48587 RepID=A0A9P7EFP7_9AGAM|nr:uncharacterized protein BJ212DRAFT_1298134 [Suillus subaureus]KAG1819697.1 hypothetical protein BJ212DRAFT_1298134 [Suillus subaureus]